LKPWPGTFTDWHRHDGKAIRVILDQVRIAEDTTTRDAAPGEIILVQKSRALVATGEGLLSIERIQTPGKRAMDVAEFLRGHSMLEGERLGEG